MRYVGFVFLFSAAVLLFVSSAVWMFDPKYRMVLDEINLAKITDPNLAWQVKPFMAKQYPHDAIMIGSSRIFYIDPASIKRFRFFNSGQAYMNPQRIYSYLEREANGVQMVVIGLDLEMFSGSPDPKFAEDPFLLPLFRAFPEQDSSRFDSTSRALAIIRLIRDNASYLVNGGSFIDAVALAFARATKTERQQQAILPAGNINLSEALLGQSRRPTHRQIAEEAFNLHLDECCKFTDFAYNPAWLDYLQKIKSILYQRQIRLIVLVLPIHERVLARISNAGKERELNRFRNDVCIIFPDAFDVSKGVYSSFQNFFDWDPMHFLPNVGAEIINSAIDGDLRRCSLASPKS